MANPVRNVDYEIIQSRPRVEQSNITYPSGDTQSGLPMTWIATTIAVAADIVGADFWDDMADEFYLGDRIDVYASDAPETANSLKVELLVTSRNGVIPVTVIKWVPAA